MVVVVGRHKGWGVGSCALASAACDTRSVVGGATQRVLWEGWRLPGKERLLELRGQCAPRIAKQA